MPNPFSTAGLFLVNIIFDLYLLTLMVRLILFWARANYFNPVTQVILKLTNPIIIPIRRIIPNIKNLETSTLVVLLLLEIIKYSLIGLITIGFPDSVLGLLVLSFADCLKLLVNTFFYAILLQAIMSWVRAGYSPVSELLSLITRPLMRPFQRLIPPVGGMDISPIPVMILLQLMVIVLVNPLLSIGTTMAFV
jgi:YggT family protein